MSTAVIIILALTVVVVLALVLARPARRGGVGGNLRKRFGPEYERTLARHDGDDRATKAELRDRLKRHGSFREQPLSPEVREQYVALWAGVQERFVDSPAAAVVEAEQLLTRLIHDRGYRVHTHEERVEALSVHRAHHVEGYRQVHAAAGRARDASAPTEDLREVLVHARELFEQLVTAGPNDGKASADHAGNAAHAGNATHHAPATGDGTAVDPRQPTHGSAPRAAQQPMTTDNGPRGAQPMTKGGA